MALSLPSPKAVLAVLKEAFSGWMDANAMRLSAALSYYTVFSIAPLLILVVAVAGLFWGNQSGAVQDRILTDLAGMIGNDGAGAIREMLEGAERPGGGGIFATVAGVATLLIGATALFAQIQDALNTVWGVKPDPKQSTIKTLLKTRLLSFGMILTVCFLLLVSLVLSVAITAATNLLSDLGPVGGFFIQVANFVVSVGIITALFALIYRYLPDARIEWRDVWVGGFVTAVLFTIGKTLIGLYLGSSSAASAYGAAGSLVILLLWIYYSTLILLFGAEITQVYAAKYGRGVRPAEHAVRVVQQTLEVDPKMVQHATKDEAQAKALDAHVAVLERKGEALPERLQAPPAPPAKRPSLVRRVLPVAGAFFIGRLTKKARRVVYRTGR